MGLVHISAQVLAMFDHDKTGEVTTNDLMAAARAQQELMNQNRHMKTLVKVLFGTLVGTLLCVFGLTVAAIELSKETRVTDVQVLVTAAGEPVQVESSQLVVAPNGELRMRAAPGEDGGVVKVSGTPTYELEVGLAEARLQGEEGPWAVEVSAEDAAGLLGRLATAPDAQVFFGFAEGEGGEAEDPASWIPGAVHSRGKTWAAYCARPENRNKVYCLSPLRRLGAEGPSGADGTFWLRALPATADAGSEGGELQHPVRRGRRIEFGWSLEARAETYVLEIWREEPAGCGESMVPGDVDERISRCYKNCIAEGIPQKACNSKCYSI